MPAPGGRSRGCFQCSKRRIICDGTEPICKKCDKKGIECSGPARIRFLDGVALRGRLKGCTVPVEGTSNPGPEPPWQHTSIQPLNIRWKDDQKGRPKRKYTKRQVNPAASHPRTTAVTLAGMLNTSNTSAAVGNSDAIVASQRGAVNCFAEASPIPGYSSRLQSARSAGVEFIEPSKRLVRDGHGNRIRSIGEKQIPAWIAPLGSGIRMLFSHFAEQVAPVMVILDSISNGYRDVLLPLACEDPLLQRAICVVATQHLALNNAHYRIAADKSRAALISQLRRDSLRSSPDRVFNVSTWATLIVLLVGETITGSSECGHMLQTLISLACNVSQTNSSSLTKFLLQQTHMFELLGQPLLGTSGRGASLSQPVDHYLDWTYYDIPPQSEHSDLLRLSRLAFRKAYQIYTGRATSGGDQWGLHEDLKEIVTQIDPDQMGSHALVWVCFIGAADSADPTHRRFFTDRMSNTYAKTGFQNIAAGMHSLPEIWSQQRSGKWTENLARLAPTLVI